MSSLFSAVTDAISSTLSPLGPSVIVDKLISTDSFRLTLQKCTISQEAESYIQAHVQYIKRQFNSSTLSEDETAQLLEQCLICNAFNYDIAFSGIYAVQLAQSAQVWRHKVLAYQACSVILTECSDIAILMVATLQRDIRAPNIRQICLALTCTTDLVNAELVPALEPIVTERTRHPSPYVSRKAIACLGTMIRKRPEIAGSKVPILKAALKGRDPQTAWIALQVFKSLQPDHLLSDSESLLKIFLHILQQTIQSKLPSEMTRGGVPAPLLIIDLISLIKMLYLSNEGEPTESKVLQLLLSTMDAFDRVNSNSGVAVMYECCMSISLYTTNEIHLSRIGTYAGLLLNANSNNYKRVALLILSGLALQNRSLMAPHQSAIVKELSSKDTVIASRSLRLIISITTPTNIKEVFQLHRKVCDSSKVQQDFLTHRIDIMTCCSLQDIDTSWFVEKLVDTLNCGSLKETDLDKLLNYLAEDHTPEDLFILLKEAVKNVSVREVMADMLSIWLWTACKLKKMDPEMPEILVNAVNGLESIDNPLYLLVFIRRSLSCRIIILDSTQLDKISTSFKRMGHERLSHVYLRNIKELIEQEETPVNETKDASDIPAIMDAYAMKCIASGGCRMLDANSPATNSAPLVFTQQPDTRPDLSLHDQTTDVPKADGVWTEKGRKSVQVKPATTEDTRLQATNEVTQLANQIFSSIQ